MNNQPKSFTEGQLAKVGVELVDASAGVLRCMTCGKGWAVDYPGRGKRRPDGYWHCPNGCNVPQLEVSEVE